LIQLHLIQLHLIYIAFDAMASTILGISVEEANKLMEEDQPSLLQKAEETTKKHPVLLVEIYTNARHFNVVQEVEFVEH
jgi:hypothetical protein